MTVGNKVKFTYKNKYGRIQNTSIILSNNLIVQEKEMSDAEICAKLARHLQVLGLVDLIAHGYIFAARNLLKIVPDATEIEMALCEEKKQQSGDNSAAGVGIILLFILAVICFPLLVMLGMRGKLFLKKFYKDYSGEEYKKFTKNYTFIGIGLYALVITLIAVDKIFKLYVLTTPAITILLFGGIAYFVVSLVFAKKKFAKDGEPFNLLDTLKIKFKKSSEETSAKSE